MDLNEAKKLLNKRGYKLVNESITNDEDYYTTGQEVIDTFKAMPFNELLDELAKAGYNVEHNSTGVVTINTWLNMSDGADDEDRNIVFYGSISDDGNIKIQDYEIK